MKILRMRLNIKKIIIIIILILYNEVTIRWRKGLWRRFGAGGIIHERNIEQSYTINEEFDNETFEEKKEGELWIIYRDNPESKTLWKGVSSGSENFEVIDWRVNWLIVYQERY